MTRHIDEVWRESQEKLAAFIGSRVGYDDTADLLQEVFLKMRTKLHQLENPTAPRRGRSALPATRSSITSAPKVQPRSCQSGLPKPIPPSGLGANSPNVCVR